MRSEQETLQALERHANTVRRLCFIRLKNEADTEDIFQTVFLRYMTSSICFESEEHEKAWFIRVTLNATKDLLKSFFHSQTISLDAIGEIPADIPPDYKELWEAVFSLPQKNRDVVYLYYFENLTAPQIGKILGKNVNTIYTLLSRSKKMLKDKLQGEYDYA